MSELERQKILYEYKIYGGEFRNQKVGMTEFIEYWPPRYKC